MLQQIEHGHLPRAQWKKKPIKRLYNIPAQQSVKSTDWAMATDYLSRSVWSIVVRGGGGGGGGGMFNGPASGEGRVRDRLQMVNDSDQ
ncbi:MAG: hypothetical protein HY281_00845 [Nitrospirae bacterium]|nr:hypothetical protein [Nitrospirota bacterium]